MLERGQCGRSIQIDASEFESWGDRLRASALPTKSTPAKTTSDIDGAGSAMKQPQIEYDGISMSAESIGGLSRDEVKICY